ncbi:MAG TPA: hypothetical protein VMJ34_17375 [Bryobacteraceae bacterium]|nr:hypothetical protein [Bryobacteraceae bacterium]
MSAPASSIAWNQVSAIVWAQWRSLWNRVPGVKKGNAVVTALVGLMWYGGVATLAVGAGLLMAQGIRQPHIPLLVSGVLFLMFLYWQFVPVMMASTGSALELRKLVVYPIPRDALFGLEVLLRVTTGIEVLMVLAGAIVGSFFNRTLPWWSSSGFFLFIVFNLLLAAGVRDLMVRLFAKRRVREITMFLVVTVAALPQLLLVTGAARHLRSALLGVPVYLLPWHATAEVVSGQAQWRDTLVLLAWIAAAGLFGRIQFARSVSVELEYTATESSEVAGPERFSFLHTWPARLFADPLAAMVEKEIRVLTRSSRFRVVFVMGFTFGLLIWVPMSLGGGRHSHSFLAENFLTVVSAYAVMLLTDLLFFNNFGPDRAAAQVYFLVPVKLERVLLAKNTAAAFFVLLQLAIITVVCTAVRLPVTPLRFAETASVCLVVCVFLLAIGNMASVWNPRPMNMAQPFRTQSSRVQWMALVAFPLACLPVATAYLARFAFDTEWAFFGVLGVFGAAGAYVYWLALETAASYGLSHREPMIQTLSQRTGAISS